MASKTPKISRDKALEKLKYEVARELDLDDDIKERGFANMTTRAVGKIGGNMVKRLVVKGEDALSAETSGESERA